MSISQREPDLQTTLQLTAVEGQGVPRGVAHVSPAALDALSCAPGDIVRIQGSRATVARIEPWPENDRPAAPRQLADGDQHIQMDGLVRQNAGVALGEVVSLTRVAPGCAPPPPPAPSCWKPAPVCASSRPAGASRRAPAM